MCVPLQLGRGEEPPTAVIVPTRHCVFTGSSHGSDGVLSSALPLRVRFGVVVPTSSNCVL